MATLGRTAVAASTALLAACLLLSTPSPARADARPREELIVFAASSLATTLPKVAERWVAQGHAPPKLRFDASSRLARQLDEGAGADVFVSADLEWMRFLVREGLVVGEPRTLVGNRLVVVARRDAKDPPRTAGALATVPRLALAGENVPAGRYARAALASLGVWDAVKSRVVNGASVRQVLEYVARGEVPAGLVYATDALAEPRVATAFEIPADAHPPIAYPVAVLKGPRAADATRFVDFLSSPEATAIFRADGFVVPPARDGGP